MQILRTPDERFAELVEFPYRPKYCEVDDAEGGGLRVAWVEHGPAHANPVLMLHGDAGEELARAIVRFLDSD